MKRVCSWAGRAIVVATLLCGGVNTASAAGADDDRRFALAPYLWLPGIDASLGIRDVPVDVGSDTPPYDMLGNLDFALLLAGEARQGKLGLAFDFQTVKLSDDGTIHTPNERGFDYGVTIADATLALEYRVLDTASFSLDALAGGRVIYAKVSIDLEAIVTEAPLDADQNKTWVDPIVGAKCRYHFNDKWAINAYGDIGGFGAASDLTYQALGTVSYHFDDGIALHAGYRLFADDYERGGFKLDVKLHGPVIGLAFSF